MNWLQKISQALPPLQAYKNMQEPNDKELADEFDYEVAGSFRDGTYTQRWPGMRQPPLCFRDVNSFISAVRAAPIVVLNEQQIIKVYNYKEPQRAVNDRLSGKDANQGNEESFGEMPNKNFGDLPAAEDGKDKLGSYRHKLDVVRRNDPISYPILINFNGQLCHVTAGTRQAAAIACGFVLPVKVLEA